MWCVTLATTAATGSGTFYAAAGAGSGIFTYEPAIGRTAIGSRAVGAAAWLLAANAHAGAG